MCLSYTIFFFFWRSPVLPFFIFLVFYVLTTISSEKTVKLLSMWVIPSVFVVPSFPLEMLLGNPLISQPRTWLDDLLSLLPVLFLRLLSTNTLEFPPPFSWSLHFWIPWCIFSWFICLFWWNIFSSSFLGMGAWKEMLKIFFSFLTLCSMDILAGHIGVGKKYLS